MLLAKFKIFFTDYLDPLLAKKLNLIDLQPFTGFIYFLISLNIVNIFRLKKYADPLQSDCDLKNNSEKCRTAGPRKVQTKGLSFGVW